MQYKWRSIEDDFGAGIFAVAPFTGHLVSMHDKATGPSLLGFSSRRRGVDVDFARGSIRDLNGVQVEGRGEAAARLRARVDKSLRYLPLVAAVAVLDRCCRPERKHAPAISEAMEVVAHAFGSRSRKDCLPVSLCRYLLLKKLNIPAAVHVGVFVPTEKMHAWIEVDGQPWLESEDVLMHYQSCLKFIGHGAV